VSTPDVRALVAEDDSSWQQILTEILSDMGLTVDVADSVDSAVAGLRAAPHRLAVVDLSLVGSDPHNQDGLLILQAIRRYDPGCAAIMLTGFATVELAVSALTAYGAYTCLRKETFRRAEFRHLVQQALLAAPPGVRAPRQATEPTVSAPAATAAQTPVRGQRVLVVEDDAGWRSVLTELLADMGHHVRPAASYGEALGLLRRQRFDLAVVDLSLAGSPVTEGNTDGYRVLANTHAAAIPTIVVSGTAAPDDVERAYNEFAILACLQKQAFDRSAFRQTVQDGLAKTGDRSDALAGLTQREREVLALLAKGLPNGEIGATLVISTNTVKRHLKAIYAKLGVSTRTAATARAMAADADAPRQ
jgi:DNA-binding NarL/FixJ family response regulator